MGRAPRGVRTVLLAAFAFALHLNGIDSVMNKTNIPPPSNLNATMENLFVVTWTWDPPENHAACKLKYMSVLNGSKIQSPHNIRKAVPHDLNNEICFEVKAICENAGESDGEKHCSNFMKGYPETSVTDFQCTLDDEKEMECTWDYQSSTPPETNYILYYMFEEQNEIHECQEYIHKAGVVHGCKFYQIQIEHLGERIHILVTDSSLTLGRFYTSLEPIHILRPLPPHVTVTKLSIDRIQVKWNDSKWQAKDYEVQSKDSKSQTWTISIIPGKDNYIIDSARRDAMYTVRVRAKYNQYYGGELWSNWSTETSVGEHRDDDWTVHYILLITIPLIAAIATILLLVFLKRLKILICPPIPDPSKMFRDIIGGTGEEFQQWIKTSPMISPNKLVQEETWSVILVEKETSPETPP